MDGATCERMECEAVFKVLLVDDNAPFRMMISKQLQDMGCEVQSAPNAGEFLGKLMAARDPFDLAVVDFNLPDLRGDMIISWLSESEEARVRDMPVLVVTGSPSGVSETLPDGHGRINLLSKPYKFDELETAVSELLSGDTQH